MKISAGIDLFHIVLKSIEEVWKMVSENVWDSAFVTDRFLWSSI